MEHIAYLIIILVIFTVIGYTYTPTDSILYMSRSGYSIKKGIGATKIIGEERLKLDKYLIHSNYCSIQLAHMYLGDLYYCVKCRQFKDVSFSWYKNHKAVSLEDCPAIVYNRVLCPCSDDDIYIATHKCNAYPYEEVEKRKCEDVEILI